MAAAVAVALGAQELLLLTTAPGLLRDPADAASVQADVELSRTEPVSVRAGGGMGLKLVAAREALLGVPGLTVRIADGRGPRPVHDARHGGGTRAVLAGCAR